MQTNQKLKNLIKNTDKPYLIEKVFDFAQEAYKERERMSQENYIDHALRVALLLKNMGLDSETLAAALLHDVVDESPSSAKKMELREIERKFGKETAFLVEKVSGLGKIHYPLTIKKDKAKFTEEKFENLRRMFFAQAQDLRVILIELASRLDNLHFLNYLQREQQVLYALETLKIFAPIAERLGIWEIKSLMEDLSFSYLFPEKSAWVKTYIKEEYRERAKYLKTFAKHLKRVLEKERVKVIDINWRPKTYWSTYRKLLKKNMDIGQIHDLLALRIIVDNVNDCYKTLGIIHKYYKPLEEEIDDYIAKPKTNGYRSLHTTVFSDKGQITEIQIKTPEMHKEAEYGICAHWAYKEKIDLAKDKEGLKLSKEIPEFLKTFRIDFYENKTFVFTPKGDVVALAKDSTPIDFAYAVHSDIGNHCDIAKANGKIIPLSEKLKNGDVVEIIINKKREPSLDWLKTVKTNLAISHIKKELARAGISAKIAKIPSIIKRKVFEITEKITRKEKPKRKQGLELYLAGQKGIRVTFAKCCFPEPGDKVEAYLSKYRAAVLHKVSCKDFQKLSKASPDKVIEAHWEER